MFRNDDRVVLVWDHVCNDAYISTLASDESAERHQFWKPEEPVFSLDAAVRIARKDGVPVTHYREATDDGELTKIRRYRLPN